MISNVPTIQKRLLFYAQLMRLDKPIGTLLLLWPTLSALWFATGGVPPLKVCFIFSLGTLLMRSAGCVVNDLADRNFDPHVARTQNRPLAARLVSPKEALILFIALCLVAFALILPILNAQVFLLALVAVFLAVSYPLTKRFFAIPQAYLGIAFGFGIPMGYAVIQGTLPYEAWILLLANIFWSVAYDTAYAMVDREDDLKIGIKTSAITFGKHDVQIIMACYAMNLALIGSVGYLHSMPIAFYGGLVIAAGIALYHYTLIRERIPQKCFTAFRHNNWLGAAVFGGIFAGFWSA